MIHLKAAPNSTYVRHARRHAHRHPAAHLNEAREFDWGAAGWAGLVAGILYILVDSTMVALFTNNSSSDLVRQIAGIALGPSGAPPTTYSATVLFAATVVHLPLSLLYARLIAAVVQKMAPARATACGAVLGAGLYALNYYGFTLLFPWFAIGRGWITLAAHVFFGAAAAWIYIAETGKTRYSARVMLAH